MRAYIPLRVKSNGEYLPDEIESIEEDERYAIETAEFLRELAEDDRIDFGD